MTLATYSRNAQLFITGRELSLQNGQAWPRSYGKGGVAAVALVPIESYSALPHNLADFVVSPLRFSSKRLSDGEGPGSDDLALRSSGDAVEVLGGLERRRRWSLDDKARIVEETLTPGAKVTVMPALMSSDLAAMTQHCEMISRCTHPF
jgi:hypothetical protein